MSPRSTHTPHNRWLGLAISLPGPALWHQCKPNYSFSSQQGQNSSSGASSPLHYHTELVVAILSPSLPALVLPALDTGYGFAILKGIVPWSSCDISAGSEFPSPSASPAMGCPQTTAPPTTHTCHSLPPGLLWTMCPPWMFAAHGTQAILPVNPFDPIPSSSYLNCFLSLCQGFSLQVVYEPFPLIHNEDTFPTGLSHPAEGCSHSIQVDSCNGDIYVKRRHLSNHQSQRRRSPSESLNSGVKLCFLKAKASTEDIQPQGPGLCSA